MSKKVYVVFKVELHEGSEIVAIYTTQKRAMAFIEILPHTDLIWYTIEEYTLNKPNE